MAVTQEIPDYRKNCPALNNSIKSLLTETAALTSKQDTQLQNVFDFLEKTKQLLINPTLKNRETFLKARKKLNNKTINNLSDDFLYSLAQIELEETIGKTSKSLKEHGNGILEQTKALQTSPSLTTGELANILMISNEIIKNPSNADGYTACAKQVNTITKRQVGKKVGGVLVALAGAAMILTSLVVAGASLGSLTPLSITGVAIGFSLIASGVGLFKAGQKNHKDQNTLKSVLDELRTKDPNSTVNLTTSPLATGTRSI